MSDLPRRPLSGVVTLVTERAGAGKDPSMPYVGLEQLPSGGSTLLGTLTADDSISINNVFRPGHILFGKLRPRLRKCLQVSLAGYSSTDILVLRANDDVVANFAGFVLQSDSVFREAIRTEEGTKMPRTSWDALKDLELFCPDNPEQRRIADILGTVDEAIEHTEALIAKTEQIKAGLMHDLFTRGIGPDGRLRPPREEAPELYKESPLGWIPHEWAVELLDELALRGSGHTPNKNHPEYWNGGIKWVSLADSWRLDRVHISDTETEISEQGIQNSSAVRHPSGIVVLSRDAGVGKSAITTCEMAVSQHFMCWRCGPRLDKYFLYYWFQHRKWEFENIATGSTIPTIGLPFFRKYRIVAPVAIEEQRAIGGVLLATDEQVFALESELDKLREVKAGLMDDLLTGRVRVPLPTMAGEDRV